MEKVTRIYRGIEPQDFPFGYQPDELWLSDWYKQFPQLLGKTVLTLPGRLTRLKGHNDFIDMIGVLLQRGENVHGVIVGGEDPKRKQYAQELRERLLDKGLREHITLTGARSDMCDIYAVSDLVFSLSTKPESFGRTTCEALSVGTPVLGLDHGGVGEILSRLFPEGLICKGATPDQLADLVTKICNQGLVPENLSVFTRQKMLDETINLYCSLLSE